MIISFLVMDMQNFRHIAQNAGPTMQNKAAPHIMLDGTHVSPMAPAAPLPLYMKKLMWLEMIFRTLGNKKIKK